MPIPPIDLIWTKLLSIVLPGLVASTIVGFLLIRWKLVGVAVFAGFIAANIREPALPWFEWDRELGRVLLVMLLSLGTMILPKQMTWQRLTSMAWIGLLCTVLFHSEDIPLSHLSGGAALGMLSYIAIALSERRLMPLTLAALAPTTGLATAIVMIHAHTARLSDIGAMWMVSCSGLFLVTLWKKNELNGVAGLSAVLFPYLLYYGQQSTFSEVPWVSFALIALAPLSCLFSLLPVKLKKDWLVSITWVILLALAVGLAMHYETVIIE